LTNHVVLPEEDLMLMYCLMGKIQVNWVSVIKEHIIKIRRRLGVDSCFSLLEFYQM